MRWGEERAKNHELRSSFPQRTYCRAEVRRYYSFTFGWCRRWSRPENRAPPAPAALRKVFTMASLSRRTYTDKTTGKRCKTKNYYGKYRDGGGNPQRVPLSPNKEAAQRMLNELVNTAEMEKAGVRDPYRDHRSRSLADHLAD